MERETVILDGSEAASAWPVELALSLLNDPTPWGTWWPGHPEEHAPNRCADFRQLALWVNSYPRHPPGSGWQNPLHDAEISAHLSAYSTQDLLDGIFRILRADRFHYGFIRQLEPQLRAALAEVVRRVQFDQPPRFILARPQRR